MGCTTTDAAAAAAAAAANQSASSASSSSPSLGGALKGKGAFSVCPTRRLGKGSYSIVVMGEEKESGSAVAVKMVDLGGARRSRAIVKQCCDPDREVTILRALNKEPHPNVVRLLGSWAEGGVFYVVTELCGCSFINYLSHHGNNPTGAEARVVRRMLAETVLGLGHLADCGVVHRDIKPDNLLLTADNHIKIADMGSAIFAADVEDSGFAGSPEYAPPEMLRNSCTSGAASDVWSFGCVVFEVHSGCTPFHLASQGEVDLFRRIEGCEVGPHAAYAPADARALTARILVPNPEARPTLAAIRADPYFADIEWPNLHEYCNVTLLNANHTTYLERFLYKGEKAVHSGEVRKTRHLSTKTRILVATTLPRIFYFEKSTDFVKGAIPLAEGTTYATLLDDSRFEVHTLRRVYHFSDPSQQAQTWVGKINDIVKML